MPEDLFLSKNDKSFLHILIKQDVDFFIIKKQRSSEKRNVVYYKNEQLNSGMISDFLGPWLPPRGGKKEGATWEFHPLSFSLEYKNKGRMMFMHMYSLCPTIPNANCEEEYGIVGMMILLDRGNDDNNLAFQPSA